jgi:hypothetical protein
MTRFVSSPIGTVALGASLLVNVALVVVALSASGHLPALGSQAAPSAMPKAYDVEGAGEGLVGPGVPAAASAVKVYANPYAGEGRTNVTSPSATRITVPSSLNPYMGEGRTNVTSPHSLRPVIAYAPLGQGEGWMGGGFKNEHALAMRQIQDHDGCEGVLVALLPACGGASR